MIDKKNFRVPELKDLTLTGWSDYELVDSGNRKKLERFGSFHLIRFEPEASWKPSLSKSVWETADAEFNLPKGSRSGSWNFRSKKEHSWSINVDGLQVILNISGSRHIGIFPEQLENWRWIEKKINTSKRKPNILNLFAYTGIASLFAARAGAYVTHVDASRRAIDLCKKSLSLSSLAEKSIRWIVDDVIKFIKREIRRGRKYDGIILDPPIFGRGPKGEIWKLNNYIEELFILCKELLNIDPILFIITAYNTKHSPEKFSLMLQELMCNYPIKIEYGNLIQEVKCSGKKIYQAVYARWQPS